MALCTIGGANAQDPAPVEKPEPVTLTPYSDELSRAAFTACDRDGDDRLNIFEVRQALETVTSVRNAELFLRLDADNDGFLEWPEFDSHFRETTTFAKPLVIQPVRPLSPLAVVEPADTSPSAQIERQLLRLLDGNRDGVLATGELTEALKKLNVPDSVIASIDRDGSNSIDRSEIEILANLFPTLKGATRKPQQQLPGGYGLSDDNNDGRLDTVEMAEALRRLDPSLARWGDVVVREADRDRNSKVGGPELQQSGGKRSITFPGQKPKK